MFAMQYWSFLVFTVKLESYNKSWKQVKLVVFWEEEKAGKG